MATAKMLEFIIGLVIVIIVFVIIGGCVTKFLNPKCDLRAVDAFDDFIILYGRCMDKSNINVCKCGDFDIKQIPPDHKISITPSLKDNKERVRISLVCNGRVGKTEYIENEKIRVYFPDGGEGGSYIYEDILNEGFELGAEVSKEAFHIGEMPGTYRVGEILYFINKGQSIFDVHSNLNLVYLNGKVAFLATTKQQQDYLKDNPLPNC